MENMADTGQMPSKHETSLESYKKQSNPLILDSPRWVDIAAVAAEGEVTEGEEATEVDVAVAVATLLPMLHPWVEAGGRRHPRFLFTGRRDSSVFDMIPHRFDGITIVKAF